MKDGKKRLYLFGDERTPADCSLFGLLTVFFGIPLTVPPMVEYMQAVKVEFYGKIINSKYNFCVYLF
jgi:glutathione S-transferase